MCIRDSVLVEQACEVTADFFIVFPVVYLSLIHICCANLAAAIAKGEAPVNACPVGGEPVGKEIAKIMGVEAGKETKKVAGTETSKCIWQNY